MKKKGEDKELGVQEPKRQVQREAKKEVKAGAIT